MLFKIAIVIIVTIALFAVFVSMQPSEFKITRTITISAPADAIFPHVNNLHKWDLWSPWAKLDLNAKYSFQGPDEGVGAMTHWVGNSKVGEGSMTITESRPNEFIKFKLDFLKPMKATNTAEFVFEQQDTQTLISWSMYGQSNFIGKAISLVFNCEKMVGGQFEKGLADLKSTVEAEAKK